MALKTVSQNNLKPSKMCLSPTEDRRPFTTLRCNKKVEYKTLLLLIIHEPLIPLSPSIRLEDRETEGMVEEIRYRSYAGASRNLGTVNVRRLSENYNTMYVDRYTSSSQYMTWAPPPAPPPIFLRQQRALGNVAPMEEVAEASTANNKPFKLWWNDPEMKRRGRVAKYKFYGAEGKMKMSLKKGYRWIKKKCLEIVRNL